MKKRFQWMMLAWLLAFLLLPGCGQENAALFTQSEQMSSFAPDQSLPQPSQGRCALPMPSAVLCRWKIPAGWRP